MDVRGPTNGRLCHYNQAEFPERKSMAWAPRRREHDRFALNFRNPELEERYRVFSCLSNFLILHSHGEEPDRVLPQSQVW